MTPQDFSKLIARFYGAAAKVVDAHDGLVDKFVGDAAVALFIPGFSGGEHASHAIAAGRELLERTGNDRDEPWIPIGIGIHTGIAFAGTVGEGDAVDFTALGDTVNAASRIAGMAGPGELLVSEMTAEAAGLDTDGLEQRTLELRGREQPVEVWVRVGASAGSSHRIELPLAGHALQLVHPRSSKSIPEPATRSRTVPETRTSPGPACAGDPRADVHGDAGEARRRPPRHSPVCTPARISSPSARDGLADRLRAADRARRPVERRRRSRRRRCRSRGRGSGRARARTVAWWRVEQLPPAAVAELGRALASSRRCR